MRLHWALLLWCGCGRIAFDPVPIAGDAGGDSGVVTGRCGGPQAITDNFDDGVVGPGWYSFADPGTSTSETGGELVITLADNQAAKAYAGYQQARITDLRGSRVYVELTAAPNGIGEAVLEVFGDTQSDLAIDVAAGMLSAITRIAGNDMPIAMLPYDTAQHRWLQLREDTGTVYFETSADGVHFTSFATTPTPPWAPTADIQIYGGTYTAQPSPGAARFDNLNGGGPPAVPWCKASSFVDPFSTGSYAGWERKFMNGGCTLAEIGGQLVVTLDGAGDNVCGVWSGTDYDLTGDAVFTAINPTANRADQTYSFLHVVIGNADEIFEIGQSLGSFACNESVAGTPSQWCNIPFDPIAHRFWRLRESGGSLVWETSPDSLTWSTQATHAEPFSFADVSVQVGAGANGANASPGTPSFDAYNE